MTTSTQPAVRLAIVDSDSGFLQVLTKRLGASGWQHRVLASPVPGANGAGVRLLIWHGLEGLLFLAGVAFHLSAGSARNEFT